MASKSPQALVEPNVLKWARTSAGLSLDEAAKSLQTKPERLEEWEEEASGARPSMSQLRRMAIVYRRLLSDFYLPAPPPEAALPHDFRRLPGSGDFTYSKVLRYQLRQARMRRELAIDLAADLDFDPAVPRLDFDLSNDPESVGGRIRDMLGVRLDEQRTWRDARKGYNGWRALLERAGVLVFQVAGVAPSEMLGFSLSEKPFPVVGVNRKLTPNGRTFTLLHELVHVLIGESSICDIEDSALRPPQEQLTEIFCNAVAGAALVPSSALLAEPLVANQQLPGPRDWSNDELQSLARTFGVSEHVILRRLLTLGRTSQAFYASRLAIWRAFEPTASPKADDEYRRNMPQEVVSDLGRPFTRLVLDNYLNSRMSLSDVTRHLGLRAQQVAKVQELVLGG